MTLFLTLYVNISRGANTRVEDSCTSPTLATRATEPAVQVVLVHLERIQGIIRGYINFHADCSGSLIVLFVCSVIQWRMTGYILAHPSIHLCIAYNKKLNTVKWSGTLAGSEFNIQWTSLKYTHPSYTDTLQMNTHIPFHTHTSQSLTPLQYQCLPQYRHLHNADISPNTDNSFIRIFFNKDKI